MMMHKIHTVLLLTIALLAMQSTYAGEMRVWQSSKGSQIKAELLFLGETLIVLKTEAGKEVSTPINSLVAADVAYLKQLQEVKNGAKDKEMAVADPVEKETPPVPPKEVAPAKGNNLSTLTEGKGKGFHAYYEGEKYIAKVLSNGVLIIYYKDETGKVDERWKMRIAARAIRKDANGWIHYKYEKMLKTNPAKSGATEVKYTFQSEAGISCDVIFEFAPEGFTTWTRSEESDSTPEDVIHMMSHHFTGIDQVSKDKAYLKKMKIKRKTVKGEREKYDFTEVITLTGDTEEYEISGPFFGKTKLKVTRAKDKEAKLSPSHYPGTAFSGGFSMNGIKTDCKTNDPDGEQTTISFK
ncbi:MAG: hypothetical protein ACJAR1_000984 [Rubritalea sp.]|jgi:hypothetical protein